MSNGFEKTTWIVTLLICVSVASGFDGDLVLRFDQPATKFTQSLPLGNGRLGAMLFGDVQHERIVLNENELRRLMRAA